MYGDTGSLGIFFTIFYLVFLALYVVVMWKVYEKAGYPGWGAIIPIYNIYILIKMANYSGWFFFLLFVPAVNFVVLILIYIRIAAGFGKDVGFALGLMFLSVIFFPILAFGESTYDVSRIK